MQAIVKILDGKAAELERRFGAQAVAGAFLVQALAAGIKQAGRAAVIEGLKRLVVELAAEPGGAPPGARQAAAGDHEHPVLQRALARLERGLQRDYDGRTIVTALTTVAIDRTIQARGAVYAAGQLAIIAERMERAAKWH